MRCLNHTVPVQQLTSLYVDRQHLCMSTEPIAAFDWLCSKGQTRRRTLLHGDVWATVSSVNTATKACKQKPRNGCRTLGMEQLRTSIKTARSWSGGRSRCNWPRVVSQAVLPMKNGLFIGSKAYGLPKDRLDPQIRQRSHG